MIMEAKGETNGRCGDFDSCLNEVYSGCSLDGLVDIRLKKWI